jgi:peptidoglycan/LPS O-acetylase OafA/YrhL
MTRGTETLGAALSGRDNALGFVRLVLALLVIVGHTTPLGGFSADDGNQLGGLMVGGFFLMSGYLIAESRVRLAWGRFLWHRALRIMPGFWVCLVVTAVVIAPLTALVSGDTWHAGSALGYVVLNSTLHMTQPGIADTLTTASYPEVWNGSLWSLEYELAAYLGCAVVLGATLTRRHASRLLPLLAGAVLVAWPVAAGLGLDAPRLLTGMWLAAYFLTGMALWSWRDKVPASAPLAAVCAVAAGVLAYVGTTVAISVMAAPLAYLLMWAAARLPTRIGSRRDLSYGIYIYGFPIQQAVAATGVPERLGWIGMLVVSLLVVVPVAWLSWTFVEKPALDLKNVRRRPKPVPAPETRPDTRPDTAPAAAPA